MISDAHGTQEELALYAMQALGVEKSSSLKMHLQICSACRKDLAEVWGEWTLLEFAVQQQELPLGARQRFMERIADSASVKRRDMRAEVPAIRKKSLLSMRGPAFVTHRNEPKARMRIETDKPATSRVVAARILGILSGL
jgi:hypothetical protein